ncbi:Protein CBG14969 [Caenorhabditis briggsae]|uniref:Protein CBG14969 n=1 Tax=Caenorhabditis briggsae TaxID=6238 RepID=A8XL44_CAEBR|nr:Protein CBG14969 [Caenorhabditis briggsae]CAP33369.2 Protein CBG14969 [Caenorhabditis briggsae]
MAQVESDIVPGNVRDMVNRLSRDMTNRAPFSVHQQIDRRPLPTISAQPPVQLFVATYAYSSKQEDELSFVAGDIIELINEVEDGWSRGKLKSNGTIGMFPTNFVAPKVVPTTPPSTTTAATATNSATATTSAARPKTGNSEVVMRAEPKAIDRTPSTIISEQPSVLKTTEPKYSNVSTVLPSSASSEIKMARVKFVYVPQHDDELALRDIDMLLNITTKNCGDAGWFEGELNGKKGLFPDNFVELVQVPVGTESGAKYSSVSRATALNLSHKPPPMNPPQPAVPPKPSKVATTDPIPSTILPASQAPIVPVATTSTNNMPSVNASKNNNFAALREKMSNNLKVVAPEKVASIQQKPTEPRDRSSTIESSNGETPIDNNSSGDQVTELQHITKNRARPPKNRPMSMVMNRHRSSDESPTGRLSSPTSVSTINAMSASMFVAPATKDILIPSNSTSSSPFKTSSAAPATVAPPSSASKPALRPIASNNFTEHHDSSVIRKLASPESGKSPDFSSSSVYVSRSEYDDLLDRFRALEARVIALEKLRS